VFYQLTLASDNLHERTSFILKNNNGLWTTMKVCPRYDIARTADNLRADSHPSSSLNELEHPPDKGTPRSFELIELRNGESSAAWLGHSAPIGRSIRGNPHDL
jgi:hypothetical protein